ncbi:MAG: B12-binding domain-containing radical SAM protein [Deltaproteobacteria bacterium]|nr:B12-binding domain-containing radical SAM protein [Deltaproteobacteria bacterium]
MTLVRPFRPYFGAHHTHPLGLMYLASYARAHGHNRVAIVDNRIEKLSDDALLARILATKPDIIGITGMTSEALLMADLARRLRRRLPHVRIVAGGSHATAWTKQTLRQGSVDVVVRGEGEAAFVGLLDAWQRGGDLRGVPGLSFLEDGRVVDTGEPTPVPDLDAQPYPAWDLIPVEKYFGQRMADQIRQHREIMTVFTSRACPYPCTYCHDMFGKTFRARSAAGVVDELRVLRRDYGIREIHVADDIFNIQIKRAKEIFHRCREEGVQFVWSFPNGLRADIMDDELLDLMRDAGVRRVAYAVETASPRFRKAIRKHLDLAKVADTVKKTAARGIFVNGFFMLGFPGETRDEMEQTIQYARDSEFHTVSFHRVIPNRGTALYNESVARRSIS